MSYIDQITKHLPSLSKVPIRLPHSQQERLAVVLGTTAVVGTSLVLPALYRDYEIFISYGPGGPPSNLLGWVVVRTLFQPFMSEMLDTEVYTQRVDALEGHGAGGEGYLNLTPEQARPIADRPIVGPHVAPQRQLTQLPEDEIRDKLDAAFKAFGFRNHHLVKWSRSLQEAHADALFLADHIAAFGIAKHTNGELAHIHNGGDHSAHFCLSPADCKKVIEAGWGQRHGFSGTSAITWLSLGTRPDVPVEYLLIYAPRNDAEIDTFMQILAASIKFTTGREDVR
ncbi:uncharacterized protein N7483_003205 [Penicillium malachiteum]|uniref:uncharacterized protein n=1 Tax=Penicillium malachiteum TaxID=1324776 RepID=UPI002546CA7B|nr:uncharacterized protein N7483_003205 [Penicillium malachiteum]KAJ5728697.1 hypothetical protein N7483_003205 [Penicillium malachiteum]